MYEDFELEYDSTFSDPNVADAIIAEASQKLRSLLKQEAKDIIDEANSAQERLLSINREIGEKQLQLHYEAEKLKKLQEEITEDEMHNIPRRYIERFVRKATKNFAPGDTVYQVSIVYKTEPCGLCAGTGKVLCAIKEGNEQRRISCPDCNGTGNLRIAEEAVQRKTIDRIDLTLCFKPDRVSFWNSSAIMLRGNDFKCDPRNLYATEKEALEAIKEAETHA